ncbi:EAL domain-containing protein [Pseudidiomarina halophila]|uniref:protein-glutamate O-methyltransferase n=1 Tax=Pseudidiomarina halophila TaxID=1449799 RepID=A0A432XTJ2_9GAMM|nr:EAL domain-containing protein [Pseudidiomarina halophila]RUO51983.1 PAS domain S-box protein [Pseudidiomarina halophila]
MQNNQLTALNVIGIGASAGGLEAVSKLLQHLPESIPAALVILQHLSPDYESVMAEILGRESKRKVIELTSDTLLEAGGIYLVPPGYHASYADGKAVLQKAKAEVSVKPSVNTFFASLAAQLRERAIGIVLSGTGSDGTSGLRAIQAAGGIAIVQEPAEAKYDGMPRSAILADAADFILPVAEIAERMNEFCKLADVHEMQETAQLKRLIKLVKASIGHDFSGYKQATLLRRIKRRMAATENASMDDYLTYLETHKKEVSLLGRDLLISVTTFFRDPASFARFSQVLTDYYQSNTELAEWRVWIAGCATGEEAYSVAILMAELMLAEGIDKQVQLFATDIDEQALKIARRGRYSKGALTEVDEQFISRYFVEDGDYYEVGKKLRDMVVFAKHNLVSDPPFMRVDFITCRNVLIYFDAELQQRVLKRFHFALNSNGCMFLGRSESVGTEDDLFTVLDRNQRLFCKSAQLTQAKSASSTRPLTSTQRKSNVAHDHKLLSAITKELGWIIVELNSKHRIKRSWGNVGQFFELPEDQAESPVQDAITTAFRSELITLLHRFQRQPQLLEGQRQELDGEGWQLLILPLKTAVQSLPVVVLRPFGMHSVMHSKDSSITTDDEQTNWLQEELVATKEYLQRVLEELASSNEEMQSLNEESQVSNEQLQASNEELEAANEELQTSNQELLSLNQELNSRTHQLAKLNEEYTHVYDALDFPILVFNREARLQRFNAAAQRMFGLRQNMQQRLLSKLKFPSYLQDTVKTLAQAALATSDVQQHWCRDRDQVMQVTVAPGLGSKETIETLLLTFIDVTDIAQAHEQLRASQEQLNKILTNTTILLAMKDLSGHYSLVNPQFCESFSVAEEQAIKHTDFDLFPHAFASAVWEHDLRALRELEPVVAEHTYQLNDGSKRIFRIVHQALTDTSGKAYAILNEAEDITIKKNAEQQLQIAARVYEQAGEAIVVLDAEGQVQTVNTAFLKLTHETEEKIVLRSFWQLLGSSDERHMVAERIQQEVTEVGFWQGETAIIAAGDHVLPIWLTINRIQAANDAEANYVAVFADISNLKESQRKVEYLATHDSLTGLPNRTLFHDRLDHALELAKRKKTEVGLLFIDLDNFKNLNDTLGHDAGDELLRQAAERLQDVARDMDTVARLGGDEFTIIIVDSTMAAVERVARSVIEVLSKAFYIQRERHYLGASVGIAIFPDDGMSVAALLKAADTAMYRAKENGRGRYELYKEELQSQMLRQTRLENDLRLALQKDELSLVYQPKYALLDTPEFVGAEALLRWKHPTHGFISPAEFIPAAEISNLIVDIDCFVARKLIRQIAKWHEQGLKFPIMALNASPKSFQNESYVDLLLRLLKQYKVSSLMIQIELTERTLVTQQNTELGNIERLRNAGIQLSIDDFGTGYSSLSYLKRLPLAELKIDKSFVDGVVSNTNDEAIARAILAMAKALNIRTVAEGVETREQAEWLRKEGCDYAQGYYFSKPMALAKFEQLIQAKKDEQDGDIDK